MKAGKIMLMLFFAALITRCEYGMADFYNDIALRTTFFVQYDENEAESGMAPVDDNEYREGSTVTVPGNTGNLSKAGHDYTGWNTKADGTGAGYIEGETFTMGARDVTLFANWRSLTYGLKFESNGGTGTMIDQSIVFGETVQLKLNAFLRTNYTFTGWAVTPEGIVSYANQQDYTMSTEGATLYAKWTGIPYNIVFYPNTGTGSMSSQSIAFSDTATLNTNTFTAPTNHSFGGWAFTAGDSVVYENQANYAMDTTGENLYAKWVFFVDRNWKSIASSNDGKKLAAVCPPGTGENIHPGYIFTSADYGANWTPRAGAGSRNWKSIASSADGTKLAAVVNAGNIWTSTDSGATWIVRLNGTNRNWFSIASSADGTKLAAVVNTGNIWTSSDSGATWIEKIVGDSSKQWYSITSSSDGTKLAAVVREGHIWTSINSGLTWIERTVGGGSKVWWSIASSADGKNLVAAAELSASVGGTIEYIYTSEDYGVSWTRCGDQRWWRVIACSADGTILVAGVGGGGLYISTDFGVTWIRKL